MTLFNTSLRLILIYSDVIIGPSNRIIITGMLHAYEPVSRLRIRPPIFFHSLKEVLRQKKYKLFSHKSSRFFHFKSKRTNYHRLLCNIMHSASNLKDFYWSWDTFEHPVRLLLSSTNKWTLFFVVLWLLKLYEDTAKDLKSTEWHTQKRNRTTIKMENKENEKPVTAHLKRLFSLKIRNWITTCLACSYIGT